jgi:outer membrane protein TolC
MERKRGEVVLQNWRRVVLGVIAGVALLGGAQAQTLDPGIQELVRRYPIETVDGRQVVRVSVRDVLDLAIERSLTISAARLGEVAARDSLTAADARNNPNLVNSLQHGRSISNSSSVADFRDLVAADADTFTSALTKKDDFGITYGITYQEMRSKLTAIQIAKAGGNSTTSDIPNYSDYKDSSALSASVTVPLGKNGGRDYNLIPVRQAEVGLRRSQAGTRKIQLDLLSQVAQTYWILVGAIETVRVREEAVKLSGQLLADNRVRLQAGVLSPADVQATEAQLAQDRLNLLDARGQVLAIEDQVRAALNLEGLDVGLMPKDTPTLRPEEFELKSQMDLMYRWIPDLQLTQADIETAANTLKQVKNNDRTQMDLSMFYVFNGYSKDPFAGTSYYGDKNLQGYGVLLTYTLPLFDQATPANIQAQQLAKQQVELKYSDQKSQLSVSLQSALRNIKLSQNSVAAARESVRLAEVQFNNEIERFRLGRSTAFTVSQLQQALYVARLAEIQARVTFERNDVQRLVLTGELYKQFNLKEPESQGSK